jgi:glucose/arabinose dehydrogenase
MKKNRNTSTLVSFVLVPVLGLMGLLTAITSTQTEAAFAASLPRPANALNAPNVPPNDPSIGYSFTPIITSSLTRPIFITHAKDDRLFIMEQGGLIKIWQSNALLPTAFLSVTNLVQTNNSGYSEEGLLGLAFEPNYASTGRFYIYYTGSSRN